MDTQHWGRWVWYDLMTTTPAEAESFYRAVVGWGIEEWEGASADNSYHMWTTAEGAIGGVIQLAEEAREHGAPPHWLAYVCVPNVDAVVEKATQLGAAALLPGMDIPGVGRIATLRDPQGAVFAVFSPAGDPPGHAGPPRLGEFSWHELATTDQSAAFDFYHRLFGWEKTDAMDMGEGGMYDMFGAHGETYGGIFSKPSGMPGPPSWIFYAMVDDIGRAVDAVKANGGQVLNGPMEVPGGDQVAQCMDPQGAMFAIHAKAAASA